MKVRLKLASGEEIVGTPNYSTPTHVEIRTGRVFDPASEFHWIEFASIESWARVRKPAVETDA